MPDKQNQYGKNPQKASDTPSRPNESPKNQQVAQPRLAGLEPDVGSRAKFDAVPSDTVDGAKGSVPGGRQAVPAFATNDPRTAPSSGSGPGPM